jgi:CBS domain-containing protein
MDGEQLVGIVSERDYARKVILQDRSSRDTPVSTIMSKDIVSVRPDQSIEGCMALMTEKRIRHLPVLHDGRVVGILSIGDLVKFIIADRENLIEQLEGYITGR